MLSVLDTARSTFKGAAERIALIAGPFARRARAGRTLILAWHNILPPGARPGLDRSLHLPQARFGAQLDWLGRTHDIIALPDIHTSTGSRPRAIITFDDAYRGALTAGLAELGRRSIPATVFVAPGILGARAPWWDRLMTGTGEAVVATAREGMIRHLRGEDLAISDAVRRDGGSECDVDPSVGIATVAELVAALTSGLLTIGAHSWSHSNLVMLDDERLREELVRPRTWLTQFGGRWSDWLAYPYGQFSLRVEQEAASAGYRGGLAIGGGWCMKESAFTLPRYNVPAGLSAAGFGLRAAGVLTR